MSDSGEQTAVAGETGGKPAQNVDWFAEAKSIFWLLLAVLGFHSFIAKPFYIPSESMLPGLLVGDRLVVTKFPYGYSYVSPTIPSPVAIFKRYVLRDLTVESLAVQIPFVPGRLVGSLPERGDIVIVTPPGVNQDYIKRVIGLPGERIEVRNGTVIINGVPVKRGPATPRRIAVDANDRCSENEYPGLRVTDSAGRDWCEVPVVRETLPNGRSYDTIDLGYKPEADEYPATTVPPGHLFLMGDNRDRSADSRFAIADKGLGGPVPWENIGGRAEFISFSLDGTSQLLNPISWFTALRGGRAFTSLRPAEAE